MKKKKILSLALSAVMCVSSFSLSGISAKAIAGWSYDLDFSDNGYTFVEYTGSWTGSGYYPAVIFQKIENGYTHIIDATLLNTNCTTLTITEDGLETFEAIYAEYEEALDFAYYGSADDVLMDTGQDSIEEEEDLGGVEVYMHDRAPITETISSEPVEFTIKEETLLELCADLQEAGVLLAAEYHAEEWMYSPGTFIHDITITDLDEGEIEAIQEIVSAYDDDAVVTEGTVETDDEGNSVYGYTITPVEDYAVYMNLGSALRTAYPDATVDYECWIYESGSNLQSTSIDLLAESNITTGDIDEDGDITLNDAYLTLLAYANMQVGLDADLTDAQMTAADVNGDGNVTIDDAYLILLYYAKEQVGLTPDWETLLETD